MGERLPVKQWYIVTTYSSHEDKVAENLQRRVESYNIGDKVFRIIVANEKIQVLNKDGTPAYVEDENGNQVPKIKLKNLFPGYIFVEMIMTDDTWFIVRNTEGVTGIAGSSGGGQKPTPVRASEMETVLKRMGIVDNSMYEKYHVGDVVKIIDGMFSNEEGKIVAINKETGNITVNIVFFGRMMPVDVEFSQVLKI